MRYYYTTPPARKKHSLLAALICIFSICTMFSLTASAADKRQTLALDGTWAALALTDDSDTLYYDFTLPADGRVEISFQTFRDSTAFCIWNNDMDVQYGTSFHIDDASASSPSTQTYDTYLSAGTYHIIATDYVYGSGFGGEGNVRVKLLYTNANSTEKEPNDGFDTAMSLSAGSLVKGTLTEKDDRNDFYTFTLSQKKDIIVTLTAYQNSFAYMLYDSSFQNMAGGSGSFSGSETAPTVKTAKLSLDAGTYYIKIYDFVYGQNSTFGRYSLKWEVAPCKEHTWDNGAVTTKPTCTTPGVRTKTCTICGETTTEAISATGHSFTGTKTVTAPTCTEPGYTTTKCANCPETQKTDSTPATGHSWNRGVITTEPTCTTPGSQTKTCTKCSVTTTEPIPATGHTTGEWVVIKAPTGTETGERQQSCKICHAVINKQTISRLIVELNASSLPLQTRKSTTALKIKSCADGDTVQEWTSSKPRIVAVNPRTGKLTAKKKTGTAIITVTMKSGAKASCKVKVQKKTVKTTRLTFSEKSAVLKKGETLTLKVNRFPLTANDKLTYKTSNRKVATVSSKGKIKARRKGKATITVRSKSGKKATFKVTVK